MSTTKQERYEKYLTIHKLKEQGKTVKEIVKAYNLTQARIYTILKKKPEKPEPNIAICTDCKKEVRGYLTKKRCKVCYNKHRLETIPDERQHRTLYQKDFQAKKNNEQLCTCTEKQMYQTIKKAHKQKTNRKAYITQNKCGKNCHITTLYYYS